MEEFPRVVYLIPAPLLLVYALLLSPLSAPAADDGFTPLFNGKDLTGWTGDMNLWRVENGEIVGSTKGVKLEKNSFLSTECPTRISCAGKVKLINHNSGIQFRSEQLEDHAVAGYQADGGADLLRDALRAEARYPAVLERAQDSQRAAIADVVKHGDWNEYDHVPGRSREDGAERLHDAGFRGSRRVRRRGLSRFSCTPAGDGSSVQGHRNQGTRRKDSAEGGELLSRLFEAREAKLSYLGSASGFPGSPSRKSPRMN